MSMNSLKEVYADQLQDIYRANRQVAEMTMRLRRISAAMMRATR